MIPLAIFSLTPRITNILLAELIYLVVHLTAAPLLKIITRDDLETLAPIFSKITILWPIIRLISAYENKVINLISPEKRFTNGTTDS